MEWGEAYGWGEDSNNEDYKINTHDFTQNNNDDGGFAGDGFFEDTGYFRKRIGFKTGDFFDGEKKLYTAKPKRF